MAVLTPGIIVTLMIGVFWSTVMNPVSARSARLFIDIQHTMSAPDDAQTPDSLSAVKDLWLREGNDFSQTVIYARTANIETRILSDVTFYLYTKDAQGKASFSLRYDAKSAELTDSRFWILRDVIGTIEGRQRQSFESLSSPTTMSWDDLQAAAGKNIAPSFWQLPAEIKKFQSAGFSATPQIIKFNRLLALPLTLTAMLLIAAGASMQLTRLGGTLSLIIFGISIGFLVYFANNMISAFGETGALPPLLAAWTVPIFILLLGIARLCTLEDG